MRSIALSLAGQGILARLAILPASVWLVCLLLGGPGTAVAQEPPPAAKAPLRVAAYTVAPYVIVAEDGTLDGLSVELWKRAAAELKWAYELKPVPNIEGVLAGLGGGQFDVAIGAITATREREARVDFTSPTHRSGAAVALPRQPRTSSVIGVAFAAIADLAKLIGAMLVLLFLIGLAIWLLERPGPPATEPSSSRVATLRDGMYWAAVTMTTVGYGDKVPRTDSGRFLAVLWMLCSVFVLSIFAASVTSRLTLQSVQGTFRGQADLQGRRLGAVAQSSGAEHLKHYNLSFAPFATLPEALGALASGQVDAVVNSEGALRYLVRKDFSATLRVAPTLLSHTFMAMALPENSPVKEPLDQALLHITSNAEWIETEARYFGSP